LTRRDATHGEVVVGGTVLVLPHRGLPDGDVDLSIRPEAITFVQPEDASLKATVCKAAYLGGIIEYTLDSPIGDLFVISVAVDHPVAVGTGVGVALARHGVVVIPPSST
jgi:iron(III) transport system ATP-binding protein